MLVLGNKASSSDEGYQTILTALRDGSAMKKFKEMITEQGVDSSTAEKLCSASDFFEVLPLSKFKTELKVQLDGVITSIDALACAEVTSALGAGRTKPGEPVIHNVGLHLKSQVGDEVSVGDTWIIVYHKYEALEEGVKERLENAIGINQDSIPSKVKVSRFLHKISSN